MNLDDILLNLNDILLELHAYLCKSLRKSEDNLRKHRQGIWNSSPKYIASAEAKVQKWTRWRDLVAKIMQEPPNGK